MRDRERGRKIERERETAREREGENREYNQRECRLIFLKLIYSRFRSSIVSFMHSSNQRTERIMNDAAAAHDWIFDITV